MQFKDVVGQQFIKNHLIKSTEGGRVAHAQLFIGKTGSGMLPMAIAYARHLVCNATAPGDAKGKACHAKFDQLSHPDLHFAYPVSTTSNFKKDPIAENFAGEWKSFVESNPYGNLFEWMAHLGIEKKQGQIGVKEASEIVKKLHLKSYDGGYKVLIMWMADKMNIQTANKLLKLIEEPPSNTVLLLLAENEDQLLDTIKSRCQIVHFPALGEKVIEEALIDKSCNPVEAKKIAHQANGDYNLALHLMHHDGEEERFEQWFVDWVRTAFKAKGNKKVVIDLMAWSDSMAGLSRDSQKNFLAFCISFFRQAMLVNYSTEELVYMQPVTGFDLNKFAPYVHNNNILEITEELQDAIYHIERNANAKAVFADISIKLTRLLHKKP